MLNGLQRLTILGSLGFDFKIFEIFSLFEMIWRVNIGRFSRTAAVESCSGCRYKEVLILHFDNVSGTGWDSSVSLIFETEWFWVDETEWNINTSDRHFHSSGGGLLSTASLSFFEF